jgi:methyl-accepting chemotaxis protein
MAAKWSFGQKVGAGFAAVVALTTVMSGVASYALNSAIRSKDRVITVNAQTLVDAQKLNGAMEWKTGAARGFLLTREERFLESMRDARAEFTDVLGHLRSLTLADDVKLIVDRIEIADRDYQAAIDGAVSLRRTDGPIGAVIRLLSDELVPKRDVFRQQVQALVSREERLMEEAKTASTEAAQSAMAVVIGMTVIAVLLAVGIALVLTRTLTRQIGGAVQHVQSSSAELQSAANQQVTGARESATAMNEITTTISELLATARQIAESAQRVAHIAEETAKAAKAGDQTLQKTRESVAGIKRQVDLIVTHMLDLGKKSQQIGGILEIINELAEQTNILAINATIEAAGAGDAGKRFAVVADEIRKLADRVGGSTNEIRALVEDVRAAVNATVMTTEGGTKAVDAGTRQFIEVTASLEQITGLVGTTTQAAREIELSTKQQSTAVEQVNLAISNVAQAAKETEASSNQTLQTATLLSGLSRDLTRLIRPNGSA